MDMSHFAGLAKPTENVSEKISSATKEKDEGNKCYSSGDLPKASYYYHRALMYLNGMVGISPEDTKKVNDIKIAVYNNLAASQLKLNKPNRAITFSTKVLEIDQNNVKALFRRGKAYSTVGDLDRAAEDLQKVEKLDPNDKAVKQELALLKQKKIRNKIKKLPNFILTCLIS